MSKHKRRNKRDAAAIGEMIINAIDQGLLRSAATGGQHIMEHVLKTDPEVKALMDALIKQRLKRVLRDLSDEAQA